MSGLTDFLLARIEEDEAVARAATPGPWWNESGTVHALLPFGRNDGKPGPACHPLDAQGGNGRDAYADGEHAARWHPARVLAECEAKRRVVADPEPQYRADYHGWHITKQSMLRYLAAVYSDHPDYRDEWRP